VNRQITWKPVVGWEGRYEVSDEGQVRNARTGRVLALEINPAGYPFVRLYANNERTGYTVHRLVADAFIGPRPPGMHTCHTDGDPRNNTLANLRYDTQSGNEQDKVRHGRHPEASKTHCAQGHPFDETNTARLPDKPGRFRRRCLTCQRAKSAAYRARRQERAA
jgi:hypothetical protein